MAHPYLRAAALSPRWGTRYLASCSWHEYLLEAIDHCRSNIAGKLMSPHGTFHGSQLAICCHGSFWQACCVSSWQAPCALG